MKKRIIFLVTICLVGVIFACLKVKAENLSNCKTAFNGQCIEYYQLDEDFSQNKKCKTMQDGICTEYFVQNDSNSINNKPEKTNMLSANKKIENNVCYDTFGFWQMEDPYNPRLKYGYGTVYDKLKVYIMHIEPNSPASKAGLKIGDEIIKINNTKVFKFKSVNDYLNNLKSVDLEIKNSEGKKLVTLTKTKLCKTVQTEPLFDSYWEQVSQYDLDALIEGLTYSKRISHKFSSGCHQEYLQAINEVNNWETKRNQFRNGFNMCLTNTYNKDEMHSCLNQLVNRSLNIISQEENIEMQRSAINAQRQMQQQQVDAMNNYSHALRNQYVRVDTNVYHNGTVNVRHNVDANVNVNGNYYHHW